MRDSSTAVPLFRRLLREIAQLLAYEALADLPTKPHTVHTPLGPTTGAVLRTDPAVISVLRAGNGLLDGFLDVVPTARVGFLGMYRDHDTLEAVQYYMNLPGELDGRVTIAVDPMLATANTATAALTKLREAGASDLRLVALVAAPEGIAKIQEVHPEVRIITAALDEGLDERGYIVPGLGDAGDRIYGTT